MNAASGTAANGSAPLEVPQEIRHFLRTPGNVLLVKGTAGAGKTTFALETLHVLADPANAVYLSSRTNDVMLPRHVPWISPAWRRQVVDASRILFDMERAPKKSGNGDAHAEGLRALRRFIGGELASRLKPVDVARLGDSDAGIGTGNLVVLDSLEGLATPLDRPAADLFHDFREIAVDDYGANAVIVLEASGPTPLDYLADGILELTKERYGNTILRRLHIEKLRGVTINNPTYLYTLHEGRFRAFSPDRGRGFMPRTPRKPVPRTSRLASGIRGLDDVLGGGFEWGDTLLIEVGEDVDDSLLEWMLFAPMSVSVQQGHATYLYPALGMDGYAARRTLDRHLPDGKIDDRLRIATYVTPDDDELEPYELPVRAEAGAPSDLRDHYAAVLRWLHEHTETHDGARGVLFVSHDHAAMQYDEKLLETMIGQAINQVRREDWLLVLFRKRDRTRPKDNLPKLVRTHLRIDAIDRVPVLSIERPFLGTFGLSARDDDLELVPLK